MRRVALNDDVIPGLIRRGMSRDDSSEKSEEEEQCIHLFFQLNLEWIFLVLHPFLSRHELVPCPDLLAREDLICLVMSLTLPQPMG